MNLFHLPPGPKPIQYPVMTGRPEDDIKILKRLDREMLLELCEKDVYIFNLCNNNQELYNIIFKIN